jgi:hypothetical protein
MKWPTLSPESQRKVDLALTMVEESRQRMAGYTPAQLVALENEAGQMIKVGR